MYRHRKTLVPLSIEENTFLVLTDYMDGKFASGRKQPDSWIYLVSISGVLRIWRSARPDVGKLASWFDFIATPEYAFYNEKMHEPRKEIWKENLKIPAVNFRQSGGSVVSGTFLGNHTTLFLSTCPQSRLLYFPALFASWLPFMSSSSALRGDSSTFTLVSFGPGLTASSPLPSLPILKPLCHPCSAADSLSMSVSSCSSGSLS